MQRFFVVIPILMVAACAGSPADGVATASSKSTSYCVPEAQTGSRIKRCVAAPNNGAEALATRTRQVGGEAKGKSLPRN
jgi:hypothetical protein